MTVALVTGSNGFVGSHLRGVLATAGWTVIGAGRRAVPVRPGEPYMQVDVTDPDAVAAMLDAASPDVVIHLASTIPQTMSDPEEVVQQIVGGVRSLCLGLGRVGRRVRLVLAGSSAQYGVQRDLSTPLSETAPSRPVNAYGRAKAAAETLAFEFAEGSTFDVIAARPFNHVGPGEPTTTVSGAFAARIAAVLDRRAKRVTARDLDVVRDVTDVRDIARGYLALAEHGTPGRAYNLCSGRGTSIGSILDGLLDVAGLDRSIVDLVDRGRPAIPYQVGSPVRVAAETGWVAGIPLADSLADLLVAARERAAVEFGTTSRSEAIPHGG